MTEASKKRMEEIKHQDMFTFKNGVWPETISEQVRLRDADFACLGFKAGFETGYTKGLQDPDAQKELLDECERTLSEYLNMGGIERRQRLRSLIDKLRAVRGGEQC